MQLATFADNIMEPIDKAIADNRSFEDLVGIIEEVNSFACPICGHLTPDHRWSDQNVCLKPECPCKGNNFDNWEVEDDIQLVAQIDEVIRTRRA